MGSTPTGLPLSRRQAAHQILPTWMWEPVRRFAHGESFVQRGVRRGARVAAGIGAARDLGTGRRIVERDGRRWVAHDVDAFVAHRTLARHLAMVAGALEAHSVPYFVLEAEPNRPRIVVVNAEDRARAMVALEHELADSATYVAQVRGKEIVAVHTLGRHDGFRDARSVQVFQVLAAPGGRVLGGPELGCRIDFWWTTHQAGPRRLGGEVLPARSWVASAPNRWAESVTPDQQAIRRGIVDEVERPTLAATDQAGAFSIAEPIDVVYTWVDGADPRWLERKEACLADRHDDTARHLLASNGSRYESRDELRFSLRSLEMYAGWVRHVYLVTDDQVPPWLDVSNPHLTVVSHRTLFGDRGTLPTFNSHAIESQLHHIDGLSEHFLYLNDDVFFGRIVEPGDFFHRNGLAIFQESTSRIGIGSAAPDDPPVMSAAKNNRDLLASRLGWVMTSKFKHVPHALRRSVLTEMEEAFRDEFGPTAHAQFRSSADYSIAASLAHGYGHATGRAMPGRMRYFYADIARSDTPVRLAELLRTQAYDVFCLNDHDSSAVDAEEQERLVAGFLRSYFPLRSSFERDDIA